MFEVVGNLHFLRPWWFLALLPIAWIIWRIWQTNQKQGAWHQVIDQKFRKLLLGDNSSSEPTLNEKVGYAGLAFAWVFATIALAGPWVKSVDVPAQKSQQGVVIVMDLSLSMLADDISPNRLSRVKYALTDLLKQNPDYAVGMVAYAGSAHTILPISEDNKTLLSMLPTLNPTIMPKFGSEPLQGLQKANELLKGAKITHGHLIWITDDIETLQLSEVADWINQQSLSVSLLSVGSENGGVVQIPGYGLLKDDNDKLILPATPLKRFAELEDDTGINWQHLQVGVDNTDKLLPKKMVATQQLDSQKDNGVDHPLDIGFYFIFILIPLAAFLFRRGTLLNFAAILIIPSLLLHSQEALAEDQQKNNKETESLYSNLGDVFKSHDQQGYEAWENKEYEKAEALFDNKQWRASSLYRQGKYLEAAKMFEYDKSATGFFNQGNAYTKGMMLDKAIESYEQALLIDPEMQIAKDNLEIAHKLKSISDPQNMPQIAGDQATSSKSENQSESDKKAAQDSQQEQDAQNDEQQKQQENQQQNQEKGQANQQNSDNQNSENNDSEQGDNQKDSSDDANNQSSSDSQDSQNNNPSQNNEQTNSTNSSNQNNNDDSAADSANSSTNNSDLAESDINNNEKPENHDELNKDNAQADRLADDQQQGNQTANSAAMGDMNSDKPNAITEEEQAQINWLNQIPDQPGVFLKRKFEYQYQQNPGANNDTKKQW